ncbi:hypothetical protein FS837_005925 [Tulasnella sp. UAMH 9824]|nr:hypothetical protein FS837_005925 [Tulasnella sp. UAMH 9824]
MISQGSANPEYQWIQTAQLLLKSERQDITETFLGLWAIVVYSIVANNGKIDCSFLTPEQILRIGEDKEALSERLSDALFYGDIFLVAAQGNSQSELIARQAYSACLRKALNLSWQTSWGYLDQTARGLGYLIRNYIDPLTTLSSGEISHELVGFSTEAVLGLYDLIRLRNSPNPQETYIIGRLSGYFHFSANLTNAVADMMLDDLGPPADGLWMDKPLKPSLIRILLWVWKNTSGTQLPLWDNDELLDSTRRLWAPWEEEVAFSKTGNAEYFDKPLTSSDLNGIVEFIEFVKKDRNNSAFISRNADVGINRLYVHLEQRAEWEYQLFDMREQRKQCSRLEFMEDGLP